MNKKIGLSLSACVIDIINGKIEIREIEKIISSAKVCDDNSFSEIISMHKKVNWFKYSDEQIDPVINEIKHLIEYPRLENDNHYPNVGNRKYWVESEKEIIWQDEMVEEK